MGGILRKLVENGNNIIVAYMTSGNLAVFDHDVRRHLDFLRRLAVERRLGDTSASRAGRPGRQVPGAQAPGRRGHPRGAGRQADDPRVRGRGRPPDARTGGGSGAVSQPPVLPDRPGEEGSDRAPGRRDRASAAGGSPARSRLRGGRSLRPARDPPDVQGGHRQRLDAILSAVRSPRSGSIAARGRSGR